MSMWWTWSLSLLGAAVIVVVVKLAWPDRGHFTPGAFASDDDDGGRMVVVEREVVVGRHV